MYLPYLRGKQFELLALKEISNELEDCSNVIPIIEPVKIDDKGPIRTFIEMSNHHMKFALILNPYNGDFKDGDFPWWKDVSPMEGFDWIPAFLINGNDASSQKIIAKIKDLNLTDVMIVVQESIIVEQFNELFSMSEIKYIVYSDADSKVAKKKLKQYGKLFIRLDDNFEAKKSNSQYGDTEEKFTEEHTFYKDDSFWGLSDYTVLPKMFIEGGTLPYVLAIHLTYEKSKEEIWVRHFTSDSNSKGKENIQGKFFEAVSKVEEFFRGKEITEAVKKLIDYKNQGKYPGLGVIKKLSMENHILLMNKY
jgi:hypothetical protein